MQDFLVDKETASQLGATGRNREELLVCEEGETLDVALYLEPELLARLARFDERPADAMNESLGDFCEVAEGVSHFMYLTHTAAQHRTVSLLELEAQAEVDKFALCTMLVWSDQGGGALIHRLFEAVRYSEGLSAQEHWRYREANRLAKRYCNGLSRHVRAHRLEPLLSELRHGYRLGAEAKLAYFDRR